MFNYPRMQQRGKRLITSAGMRVSLWRYDAAANEAREIAKTVGVFVDANKEADGSVVQTITGERDCFIPGDTKVEPQAGDELVAGTNRYMVQAVEVVKPATVVVYYRLTVI